MIILIQIPENFETQRRFQIALFVSEISPIFLNVSFVRFWLLHIGRTLVEETKQLVGWTNELAARCPSLSFCTLVALLVVYWLNIDCTLVSHWLRFGCTLVGWLDK